MKLAKPEAPPALDEGDYVNASVSHQIYINSDQAWVKYEAGTKVRPGETEDEVYDRISVYVQEKSLKMAEDTARGVMAKDAKDK